MLKLTKYPNKILTSKTNKISHLNESLLKLIDEMRIAMHEYNGVGLSANQVGKNIALSVIEYENEKEPEKFIPFLVLINPKIIKKNNPYKTIEGCLSLPKQEFEITRYENIEVRNTDLENNVIKFKANGFFAQVIQHEIDHLNGVLICKRGNKRI